MSAAELKSGLTLREIAAARRAFKIVQALESPSEDVAKRIILRHSDDYHDRPLLPIDISRAYQLYCGDSFAAGKSVDRPMSQLPSDDSLFKSLRETPQVMYADLLFVHSHAFLISVVAPLYRTMIDHIPGKEFKYVTAAIKMHCDRYAVRGGSIIKVIFDGETALQNPDKVEAVIGRPFVVLPPKTHVAIVERRIRTLKERVRVAVHRLQYDLPRSLIPALLSAVVYRLNGEPTQQRPDNFTPNEVWLGRKTNLPRECEFAFGDLVTTTAPLDEGTKHTLAPRTELALILSPTDGGWWVLLLDSHKRVRRKGNGINEQPLARDIVELINARAKKESDVYALDQKKRAGTKRPKASKLKADEEWVYGFSLDEESVSVGTDDAGLYLSATELTRDAVIIENTLLPPTSPSTATAVITVAHDELPQPSVDGGVTPLKDQVLASTNNNKHFVDPMSPQHPIDHKLGPFPEEGERQPDDDHFVEATQPTAPAALRVSDVDHGAGVRAPSPGDVETADPLVDPEKVHGEGTDPSPQENPLPTSRALRRALGKKLGREAATLLGRLVNELESVATPLESPPPSRSSSRRKKRPRDGKWQVNNLRPDQAAAEYGQQETDNAIGDEVIQIVDKEVFAPVYQHLLTSAQRQKIIRTKLFLKAKLSPEGFFVKLKARLVARGDMELKATFDSLYSPTGSMESAFALLSIAAFERRKVKIIDLVGAYLTVGVRDGTETYVRFDIELTDILCSKFPAYRKYVAPDGTFCGRLNKSLYGICQASSNLHKELKKTLVQKMGFTPNPKDPCLFNKTISGKQLSVLVYVDDLLVTGASDAALDAFTNEFKTHHPEVTEKKGSKLDYLGMKIDFSIDGECAVSMSGYTERAAATWSTAHSIALKEHPSLFGGKPFKTYVAPCDAELFESSISPELPKRQRENYHSIVATMMYMAKRSRPDLLCTTALLSTRVASPTVADWYKLRRLMSYASSTSTRALILRPKGIWVEVYTDASFATHQDRKSHSGTVCTIGGAPYYCSSTRQKINAKSAAESEMISISDAGTMTQWGQQLLYHQGYVSLIPARIWEDNAATIANLVRGAPTAQNSRHYEVRYFYISDLASRGIVRVEHLESAEMTADLLTKGVSGDVFTRLSHKLMTSESDVDRLRDSQPWDSMTKSRPKGSSDE